MVSTIADRFWAKVDKSAGDECCWIWTASANQYNYGLLWVDGRLKRASHVSLFLETGVWPEPGMVVCHSCDNPICVRPAHLWIGTHQENMDDSIAKGRKSGRNWQLKGENHVFAKLTERDVLAIRGLLGQISNLAIASKFGVSGQTISSIKARRTWSHVE